MSNFAQFSAHVRQQLEILRALGPNILISKASGDALWEHYLASFADGTDPIYRVRTQHNCSCCKNFIRQVGGLMGFDGHGNPITLWDGLTEESIYAPVAAAMRAKVIEAGVEGVWFTKEAQYGAEKTTGKDLVRYDHFMLRTPRANLTDTPGKKAGDIDQTVAVYRRGLEELKPEAVQDLVDMIEAGSIYRAREYIDAVTGFQKLQKGWTQATNKEAYIWNTYNQRGARIRNDLIGQLLVELSEGMDTERAVKNFEARIGGANFQRPKALATQGMIDKARAKLDELGLMTALDRRIATFDDLPRQHAYFASRPDVGTIEDTLFGSLGAASKYTQKDLKGEPITLEVFQQKLATAKQVELYLSNPLTRRMASLITETNEGAASLFKWNNPFSWSYSGDVTDTIRERVAAKGGNVTGDVLARLAWFNLDDLDLHMTEPNMFHIHFNQKRSPLTGGVLDVDENAHQGKTRTPVENIAYAHRERMTPGRYTVFVHQYSVREMNNIGFTVEIEILGERFSFDWPKALPQGHKVDIANIDVARDGSISLSAILPANETSKKQWGVDTNTFVPVTAVIPSPNQWVEGDVAGQKHMFVTLKGCINPDSTRGFYNEFLRGELNEHRRTMEMVGSKVRAAPIEVPQLSGIGFIQGSEATFKVRDTSGRVSLYNVTF